MKTKILRLVFLSLFVSLILAAGLFLAAPQKKAKAQPPKPVRLHILDCGKITGVSETAFGFQADNWQAISITILRNSS